MTLMPFLNEDQYGRVDIRTSAIAGEGGSRPAPSKKRALSDECFVEAEWVGHRAGGLRWATSPPATPLRQVAIDFGLYGCKWSQRVMMPVSSSTQLMEPIDSDITIDSAGRELAGRLIAQPGSERSRSALLFVHGLESDQSGYRHRARAAAAELNAVCLTFDLGGHGQSNGVLDELSAADHLNDLIAATDTLLGQAEVDENRLGVCGASYGAYLAALLTAERPVRRLLLRAPALYGDELVRAPIGERRGAPQVLQPAKALTLVEEFAGKTLVLESGCDEAIPHEVVAAYVAAARDVRYEVIAGASHALTDPAWDAVFVRLIVEFFGQL
jgi:uncharacterized protein